MKTIYVLISICVLGYLSSCMPISNNPEPTKSSNNNYTNSKMPNPAGSDNISKSGDKITGVNTTFSKSWDSWTISFSSGTGSIRTTFSKSWDRWDVQAGKNSGSISTVFSKSWDRWKFDNISMSTVFSNSIDSWNIEGNGKKLQVRTVFSKSWDNWEITGPKGTIRVRTTFSKSWDNWSIDDNMSDEDTQLKIAAIFVCIISSVAPAS